MFTSDYNYHFAKYEYRRVERKINQLFLGLLIIGLVIWLSFLILNLPSAAFLTSLLMLVSAMFVIITVRNSRYVMHLPIDYLFGLKPIKRSIGWLAIYLVCATILATLIPFIAAIVFQTLNHQAIVSVIVLISFTTMAFVLMSFVLIWNSHREKTIGEFQRVMDEEHQAHAVERNYDPYLINLIGSLRQSPTVTKLNFIRYIMAILFFIVPLITSLVILTKYGLL